MKRVIFLFITAVALLNFVACKKDNGSNVSDAGLTAHSWTSYKVLNGGTDVTSSTSAITYVFSSSGTYTARSTSGTANGTWSLSGTSLNLGSSGTWTVLNFTSNDLHIKDSSGYVEIYLH